MMNRQNPPKGYIKRTSSTIPYGYTEDKKIDGYLKPVEKELVSLQTIEDLVIQEDLSLRAASEWFEYNTGRKMNPSGLKKHLDKKYGKRDNRLGTESSSILNRL